MIFWSVKVSSHSNLFTLVQPLEWEFGLIIDDLVSRLNMSLPSSYHFVLSDIGSIYKPVGFVGCFA